MGRGTPCGEGIEKVATAVDLSPPWTKVLEPMPSPGRLSCEQRTQRHDPHRWGRSRAAPQHAPRRGGVVRPVIAAAEGRVRPSEASGSAGAARLRSPSSGQRAASRMAVRPAANVNAWSSAW